MLDKVKLALRISHDLLNDDILATIESARADMIRAGVPEIIARDDEYPLTQSAIRTYCLYSYADKDNASRYWESYTYQVDCMRKSSV